MAKKPAADQPHPESKRGAKPFEFTPVIGRIYNQHVKDYAALSPTPGGFEAMRDDLNVMQAAQPNYTAADLAAIKVRVWSVLGRNDELIKSEHAEYIARSIPGARFVELARGSHFAPLQQPELFNATVLEFLASLG